MLSTIQGGAGFLPPTVWYNHTHTCLLIYIQIYTYMHIRSIFRYWIRYAPSMWIVSVIHVFLPNGTHVAQESEAGLLYFGLYLFDPQDEEIQSEGPQRGRLGGEMLSGFLWGAAEGYFVWRPKCLPGNFLSRNRSLTSSWDILEALHLESLGELKGCSCLLARCHLWCEYQCAQEVAEHSRTNVAILVASTASLTRCFFSI